MPHGSGRLLQGYTLPLRSLGQCTEVGQGAEAWIEQPARYEGLLFKHYKAGGPSEENLRGLILFRRQYGEREREFLDSSLAWPIVVILDGRQVCGFLMPPAARKFFHDFGRGGVRPRDLNYLLYPAKKSWNDMRLPTPDERFEICRQATRVVHVLHARGAVFGDISGANLLWTLNPRPRIYFVDADGIRVPGVPVGPNQHNTPDWIDPRSPGFATLETDRYKLALLILRVLASDAHTNPADSEPLLRKLEAGAGARLRPLIESMNDRDERPTAEQWLTALG